jgi:DNA replication protein DnaC
MTTDIREQLGLLGLRHTAEALDDLVALATKSRWGVQQILEHVARIELEDRARKSLERRLGRSRLGRFKAMADFDWAWPKVIDRDAVEAALRLDFLEKAHNVVLVANQGLGKTMIAQNIAHAAVQAGHSVLFTTAAQMLLDLGSQESARGLDQRLRHYCTRTGLMPVLLAKNRSASDRLPCCLAPPPPSMIDSASARGRWRWRSRVAGCGRSSRRSSPRTC